MSHIGLISSNNNRCHSDRNLLPSSITHAQAAGEGEGRRMIVNEDHDEDVDFFHVEEGLQRKPSFTTATTAAIPAAVPTVAPLVPSVIDPITTNQQQRDQDHVHQHRWNLHRPWALPFTSRKRRSRSSSSGGENPSDNYRYPIPIHNQDHTSPKDHPSIISAIADPLSTFHHPVNRHHHDHHRSFRENDHLLLNSAHRDFPSDQHPSSSASFSSGTSILLNQYGFPPPGSFIGDATTHTHLHSHEKSGPYTYLLAKVKALRFEEIVVYYIVTRIDHNTDLRAEADFMEPLRTQRGLHAALQATVGNMGSSVSMLDHRRRRDSSQLSNSISSLSILRRRFSSSNSLGDANHYTTEDEKNHHYSRWMCMISSCLYCCGCLDCCQNSRCYSSLLNGFHACANRFYGPIRTSRRLDKVRQHAILVLNGVDPYRCRLCLIIPDLLKDHQTSWRVLWYEYGEREDISRRTNDEEISRCKRHRRGYRWYKDRML